MHKLTRVAIATLIAITSSIATAQEFPEKNKPIRVLVGFAAGGGTDIQARLAAPQLSQILGVPVVVENRPGAATTIAANAVAKAPADGYTLLYTYDGTLTQNPHTMANISYDAERDFTPVGIAARGGLVLAVHHSLPDNLQDFIAYAKANPGKLSYASFGTGSMGHAFGEMFKKAANIDMVHVPYRGTADAVNDLFSGRVQVIFDSTTTAIQNSKTGNVRILAAASDKRYKALPDLPTLAELGLPGLDATGFMGFYGPAGLDPQVVQKLNVAINQAMSKPEVIEGFAVGGFEAAPSTPEQHQNAIKQLNTQWGDAIRSLNLPKQ